MLNSQPHTTLDQRDSEIIAQRLANIDSIDGPRVGDFVRFADNVERRISYHWRDDEGWDGGCQTSEGGSFYLGEHGCSFSGSLHPSVPTETLTLTDERRDGYVWIFHHDWHTAHNGVDVQIPFRVYESSANAPR